MFGYSKDSIERCVVTSNTLHEAWKDFRTLSAETKALVFMLPLGALGCWLDITYHPVERRITVEKEHETPHVDPNTPALITIEE